MAWKRTRAAYGRARSAYRSTRGYRSRGGAYAGYSRGSIGFGKGGFGMSLSMPFIAGLAFGMTDLDKLIPAPIKIAAACAPIKGLGAVKGFSQGMLLGDVVQALTGFTVPIGGFTSAGTGSSGAVI